MPALVKTVVLVDCGLVPATILAAPTFVFEVRA
jgi:hypothetical protein